MKIIFAMSNGIWPAEVLDKFAVKEQLLSYYYLQRGGFQELPWYVFFNKEENLANEARTRRTVKGGRNR